MKGSAPKSPATGSQTRVRQKEKPNLTIESREFLTSSQPIPATRRKIRNAKNPVPRRNSRSSAPLREDGAFGMTAPSDELGLDPLDRLHLQSDHVGRQRSIPEVLGVLLTLGQGPLREFHHGLRHRLVPRVLVEEQPRKGSDGIDTLA